MSIDVLPSKRVGLYFLEHTRVSQTDERVVYSRSPNKKLEQFFSIPVQNTSVILLGTGTSITQSAIRKLSDAGVMVGFTGGDGTPIFAGSLSEYRPNEYFFSFLKKWQIEEKKLDMAKRTMEFRVEFVKQSWSKLGLFTLDVEKAGHVFLEGMLKAKNNYELMGYEGSYASKLYQLNAVSLGTKFVRKPGLKTEEDLFNSFLDNGNYLAYGLASVVLWVYGLPFQMSINHGKTRRGGLVFDIADIIKDGVIMPIAMKSASEGKTRQEMRKACIKNIYNCKTLDFLFKKVKEIIEE